mmetsp:Transcript_3014/g.8204  ORF Transcript_3014/g.8204 Transcript_3014/m.8204 type:complete len:389 (-) Transcript_3014:42-1208(-)
MLHPLSRKVEVVDRLLGRGLGAAGAPGDLRKASFRLASAREPAETPPHRARHVRVPGGVVFLGEDPLDEGVDDGPAAVVVGHGDLDPRLLQHADAAAVHPGIRIPETDHDPVDTGQREGGRAGRGLPVVAAGFQRHVGRHRDVGQGVPEEDDGAAAALSRGRVGFHEGPELVVVVTARSLHDASRGGDAAFDVPRGLQQGEDLGVGVPRPWVEAGAKDVAGVLPDQEAPYGRVRKGVPASDGGVLQGSRQEPPIVVRYCGGGVGGSDLAVGGRRREDPGGPASRVTSDPEAPEVGGATPGTQDQGLRAPTPGKGEHRRGDDNDRAHRLREALRPPRSGFHIRCVCVRCLRAARQCFLRLRRSCFSAEWTCNASMIDRSLTGHHFHPLL